MKLLMAVTVLASFSLGANSADAQRIAESNVPSAVSIALERFYPGENVKWETEGANYEGEFKVNGAETSVLLDASGDVLEVEEEIDVSALPKATTDYVSKNLPQQKIQEASKITDAKGTVIYEVQIKKTSYLFDANGTFIRMTEEDR